MMFPCSNWLLCHSVSAIRLKVPVQASSLNASPPSVQKGSGDERQVDSFIWRGPFSQNHQRARLPPLPQAASRYYTNVCSHLEAGTPDVWVERWNWSGCISSSPPLFQVSPSHLRWLWPSYWRSCTTASCHRATSPSTSQSNWALKSYLTQASPRPTLSRGYALRKVLKMKLYRTWGII